MNNTSFSAKLNVSFAAYVIIYSAAVFLLLSAAAGVAVYIFNPTSALIKAADYLLNIALRSTVLSVIAAMICDVSAQKKQEN